MPPPCQQRNMRPICRDQGLLFCARPTFDLPLSGNRIGYPIEMLSEYQTNWPASGRIASELSIVMLGNAPL
jgi:hypothetical protein